ncbi:septal ring lytic transglycosylase RlpA family protein [Alteromonas sp. ASW11-36]|uniref:Endolytic peptidoglycan transglycosylase RlpA n=1 Tax=Alteromonas arenosi TaxID=3055817 RepID=A0ABT7SWS8_9ALTE|nr:septal ring lytic transglycosylase RlpA family protein [Alteromonas sp. ASW11-36]MDM7860628.1 septal ring lytic transglycosylase RlpA family protein [Alteromonas sp. ASW11-36]
MRNQITIIIIATVLIISLTGCQYGGRYSQRHDSAPTKVPDSIARESAIPHYEPYREHNSRPYTVFGKQYFPLATGKGFVEEGEASWYGQKFHGHLTSNGEVYDMYGMTAAHKTLPLPSFVKVTNVINNKSVIVRVNDRGPFHGDRIIDLSFAAAKKLDYLSTGTAPVKVEVIHFDEQNRVTVGNGPTVSYAEYAGLEVPKPPAVNDSLPVVEPSPISGFFIQVAALSDSERVANLSEVLSELYQVPASIEADNNINRLRLGPIHSEHIADLLLDELRRNGYPEAFTVPAP